MDIIGGLLRASLLMELGDDQDRVRRVRSAAHDVGAELAGKSRALVPYAVTAAVDESTPAAATPLAAAERALLSRWETFRNAFPGPPTEILRAVTLAAVAEVVEADDALRQAAWYALRTVTECLPAGRWHAPVADLGSGWEPAIRGSIAAVWSPTTAANRLRMPTISKIEDERIPIDTPLRSRAQELEDAQNYSTFAEELQGEFVNHVEEVISVSEVLAAEAYKRSVAQLKDFAMGLGARLREALAAQDKTMEAMRQRSELLWWRQTAFSARLSCAYADFRPADVAIAAAVDLHDIVPSIAPLAVEHLLADLVLEAAGAVEVTVAALAAADQANALPDAVEAEPPTLIDAVRDGKETPLVPSGKTLTAARAAVLIFRDLQARRLADTEPSDQLGEGE